MSLPGFLSLLTLAAIHLTSNKVGCWLRLWHGHFLSLAAGISFAYVFIDLLPAIAMGQEPLKQSLEGVFPTLDRHSYLIALFGLLFYYMLKTDDDRGAQKSSWFTIAGYLIFNLLIGAGLADSDNPEIQPLLLFTVAMGLHAFIEDHFVNRDAPGNLSYSLAGALLLGYALGIYASIPEAAAAAAISFVGGAIILNVLHYELPKVQRYGSYFFIAGALIYSAIVVKIGN